MLDSPQAHKMLSYSIVSNQTGEILETITGKQLHLMREAFDLLATLREITVQVDEDCPPEYRSKHLQQAIEDAYMVIRKVQAGA